MKIGIVGSTGYIAGFLVERLAGNRNVESVLKMDQANADVKLDLQHAEDFEYDMLNGLDFIIFTAAISGPDKCASEYDLCWAINVTGTNYFIHEAVKRGCKVLFFSSDAVFGDIQGFIYDENSETKAQTPYGKMKKAVEDEFRNEPLFKAIRLSYVASEKDRFISYCLKCMQTGETADVFHPFYRNVITVSDVVDVVEWFAGHWDEYKEKFLCVAGRELVSRVRIADEMNRIYGEKLAYKVSRPDEQFYKNRPAVTQMRSLFLEEYGILKDESFTEKIQRQLGNIASN